MAVRAAWGETQSDFPGSSFKYKRQRQKPLEWLALLRKQLQSNCLSSSLRCTCAREIPLKKKKALLDEFAVHLLALSLFLSLN